MVVLYGVFALVVEVAMLVGLALGVHGWLGGAAGLVLAVVAVAVVASIWGQFLGPKAPRPLARPASLAAKTALFVGVAGMLAAVGFGIFGVALGVLGLALVVLEATVGSAAARLADAAGPREP